MENIKTAELKYVIPISLFDICKIDGLTEKQIREKYNRRAYGAYYIQKFEYHLKSVHKIDLKEYCKRYLGIEYPKCPITGLDVNVRLKSAKGVTFNKYHRKAKFTKENSPKFKEFCNKMSVERRGNGNPMFGAVPWNQGLGLEHPIIRANAEKRRGSKASEETRIKMRQRRAEHPLKARHNTPHSPETVEKMRVTTAKLWASGVFNRVTSIHLKVREFLKTLNLIEPFQEEYQVKYFSMDFAFPVAKVAIEAQGTYFHIDPRIYPDGPTNAMQRRNFGRDKAKRKVCCDQQGWKIIEVWETEINDGSFKEYLLCKLKELNLLKV